MNSDLDNITQRSDNINYEYAGFLVRFIAQFVDGLILGAVAFVPSLILTLLIWLISLMLVDNNPSLSTSVLFRLAFLGIICIIYVVFLIVVWLYHAYFESSKYMGTPGKVLVGIKVTDLEGNRISFWKATLRFILKAVFNLFLWIGSLYILVSDRKQGIYDVILGTLVLKK